MTRKVRNGKYAEYEKKILNSLSQDIPILQSKLREQLDIPKTSFYQVIMKLRNKGKITDINYKRSRLKKYTENIEDSKNYLGKFVARSINRKKRNMKVKLK